MKLLLVPLLCLLMLVISIRSEQETTKEFSQATHVDLSDQFLGTWRLQGAIPQPFGRPDFLSGFFMCHKVYGLASEVECRGSDFKINSMHLNDFRGRLFEGPHRIQINQTQYDVVGEVANSTWRPIIGTKIAFDPKRVLFYGNKNMDGLYGIKEEAE